MKSSPSDDLSWLSRRFIFQRWGRSAFWPEGHQASRAYFQKVVSDYTFWFIHTGSGTLVDYRSGNRHPLAPGSCLIMQPGDDLEIEGAPHVLAAYLHWVIPGFSGHGRGFPRLDFPLFHSASSVSYFETASQHVVELLSRIENPLHPTDTDQMQRTAELLFKSILMEITLEQALPNHATRHELTMTRLIQAINEDPRRFRSAREMALFCGYSNSHFRSICQRVTGHSPASLLIQARVAHAKRYLRQTDLTVGMIAEALGYENIYYFSNQFRQVTGMTPTAYRTND